MTTTQTTSTVSATLQMKKEEIRAVLRHTEPAAGGHDGELELDKAESLVELLVIVQDAVGKQDLYWAYHDNAPYGRLAGRRTQPELKKIGHQLTAEIKEIEKVHAAN